MTTYKIDWKAEGSMIIGVDDEKEARKYFEQDATANSILNSVDPEGVKIKEITEVDPDKL